MPSSLENIRVLDLTRILAGPVATQLLGDLGADIIKVERPGTGDDTRHWGPPFLNENGEDGLSAYFLSANRNKKSLTLDIAKAEGQEIIHALAAKCDILIHNFKVGGLEKYGLGYDDMHARHPHLIYAAITGFGQTGPMAAEAGYDILAQALCGLMGHTGEKDAAPMKAGVALIDVITGLYTANGILAALHARTLTGKGQMLDMSLLDCGLAAMTNIAQFHLTSGAVPARQGNAHATIVPYQAFAATDGWIIIAIGNDSQFVRFCEALSRADLTQDPRFKTNALRVQNRLTLVPLIEAEILKRPVGHWLERLKPLGIPTAPVNSISDAFRMEQITARGMKIDLPRAGGEGAPLSLVGNPVKLSATPPVYRNPPPHLGAQTEEILSGLLGMTEDEIEALRVKSVV